MRKDMARGFSLIEVITALIIVSTIAVGIVTVFIHARNTSAGVQQRLVAVQALEKKFADMKKINTSEIFSQANIVVPELTSGLMSTVVTPDASDDRLKEVTATVSWTMPNGQTRTESLMTVFFSE